MTFEELQALIEKIKGNMSEESAALNSEDLLMVISTYKSLLDELESIKAEMEKVKATNEDISNRRQGICRQEPLLGA